MCVAEHEGGKKGSREPIGTVCSKMDWPLFSLCPLTPDLHDDSSLGPLDPWFWVQSLWVVLEAPFSLPWVLSWPLRFCLLSVFQKYIDISFLLMVFLLFTLLFNFFAVHRKNALWEGDQAASIATPTPFLTSVLPYVSHFTSLGLRFFLLWRSTGITQKSQNRHPSLFLVVQVYLTWPILCFNSFNALLTFKNCVISHKNWDFQFLLKNWKMWPNWAHLPAWQ